MFLYWLRYNIITNMTNDKITIYLGVHRLNLMPPPNLLIYGDASENRILAWGL